MSRLSKPVDHLIELPGVYDGWSIAVFMDGTMLNRWANDEGTGPAPGYERRYEATKKAMEARAEA